MNSSNWWRYPLVCSRMLPRDTYCTHSSPQSALSQEQGPNQSYSQVLKCRMLPLGNTTVHSLIFVSSYKLYDEKKWHYVGRWIYLFPQYLWPSTYAAWVWDVNHGVPITVEKRCADGCAWSRLHICINHQFVVSSRYSIACSTSLYISARCAQKGYQASYVGSSCLGMYFKHLLPEHSWH